MPETSGTKFPRGMFVSALHRCIRHASIYLNTYYVLEMLLGARNAREEKKKEILSPWSSEGHRQGPGQHDSRGQCGGRGTMGSPSSGLGDLLAQLPGGTDGVKSKPGEAAENWPGAGGGGGRERCGKDCSGKK